MKIEVFQSKFGYDNMRTSGGKPTEEMSAYLKANGYRWSRAQNCWYPATIAAREANSGFFEKFERQFEESFEHSESQHPQTDIIEDLVNVATEGKFTKEEVKEKAAAIKEQVVVERDKGIKLEELIRDANTRIAEQQKEIERLRAELAARDDGSLEEYETFQEQQEADQEAEWERENSLSDDNLKRMAEGNDGASDDSAKETVAAEPVMVTPEELETFKAFAPAAQYAFTLELAQGEEGDFFKQKIKDFAKAIESAPKIGKTDGAESHPVILRYFHPTGTEALVCEIGKDGEAFGWQCLNGDYEMAEWGYLDLEEIRGIDRMELDYHVPEGTTIERWIEDRNPQKEEHSESVYSEEKEHEEEKTQETAFDRVTKQYSEKYKDFYETYNAKKEEFLENESRYVGNARIRHAFEDIHEELVKLQVEEVNDIIKESPTIGEAKENAIRYFNFNGNDGLVTGCLYFATGIGFYDKETFHVLNEKMNAYIENKFNETHNMVQVDLDEIKDAMVEAHGGKDKPTLEDIVTDKFAEMGITDDSGHVVQSTLKPKQIQKIRVQCREILEKLDNSYFNEKEREYLKENYEQSEQDQKQVEASLRSIRYYYVTKKNKDGYWEPEEKGKEITANEARKMLSMSDFVSAIDRASFHYTSGREVQGGKGYIHFNDRDRDRVVPAYELTKEDLAILAQYEGAGGLKEENRSNAGILNEFYTPNNLVEKVWKIVDTYAPNAVTVLEPSAGVGKFANNRPNNEFTMCELDETSARINKILHPNATVIQGAYQKQFFDESERFHIASGYKQPKYDIIIGNPPYGEYKDKWKGLGEGKEFDRYEEYFIAKGLDALKDENSLLAFVVPSGFLNTDDDKQKEILATNGKLVDAYRLPEGTFPTTEVGTDIVVFKKWESPKEFNESYLENKNLLSNAEWFKQHPEKILGEEKVRTNRFGKIEVFTDVHEGLSIQNELDKIDGLLQPKVASTVKPRTILRDETLTAEMLEKVKQQYIANNGGDPVLERDFSNIELKEGITVYVAIKHIMAFETYNHKVIELNKARDRAESYFKFDGNNIESEMDWKTRVVHYDSLIEKHAKRWGMSKGYWLSLADQVRAIAAAEGITEIYRDKNDNEIFNAVQRSNLTLTAHLQDQVHKLNSEFDRTAGKEISPYSTREMLNDMFFDAVGKYTRDKQNKTVELGNGLALEKVVPPSNLKNVEEVNASAEIYGYSFEYEQHENVVDIYKGDFWIGTVDKNGDFGVTDDWKEQMPDEVGQLAVRYFELATEQLTAETANEKNLQQEIYERYISENIEPVFGTKESYAKTISKELASAIETKRDVDVHILKAHLSPLNDKITLKERFLVKTIFEKETGLTVPITVQNTDKPEDETKLNDFFTKWRKGELEVETANETSTDAKVKQTPANDDLQQQPAQEKNIKTTEPAQQRRMTVKKLRGEVMSAEEFCHLYGRDFDVREFPIWKATDWEGKINLNKLSAPQIEWLKSSGNYIEAEAGEWTHKVLFATGDIYEKVSKQKALLESAKEDGNIQKITLHEKNIELLESSKKPLLDLPRIHFGLQATLAEEFKIPHINSSNGIEELNLQESFILWAQNTNFADAPGRGEIDFATANISREEFPENVEWRDIVDFIDGRVVKSERTTWWETRDMDEFEKKSFKAEKKREADEKRQARADTANKLFDRYIHEGLDEKTRERLVYEYNRRFNSYIIPDYSKLPLFVDGMSAYKGASAFKLYDQQIKGISFLCNKGNGLLAYDVGVGKTAAGIVATVNQIQTGRSKRPLIVVPNQVYSKWYGDIRELFPKIQVNDLYNFNSKSVKNFVDKDNPHKLNIPENSISLCTYEALKNITFTDESCAGQLYEDFANLLSADFDGSDRENAGSSEKIMQTIGAASKVDNAAYYFYEDCGFDNLTVDEAHNFKNLWTVPRPKNKGESNEYKGIPAGKPSARALKMYAMTQLTQANNDNRNVFMLTATPFTNSPLEVYSMLSYVGRERLEQSGVRSLRDFLNQFAQTKQELGVTSSGEVDTKQVMKNWKELPALQSMLTEFIDKVDGEEAGIIRPYKFTHVKPLDMSPLQKKMREIDEARMAEIKEGNSAAIIVAMNNMRLSCVAPALANPAMYEGQELPPLSQLVETSPKLKFVCDAIIDMYKGNPEKGQFMYVPLGKDSHGIIKDYLVAHGIPKNAVEIVNGEVNNTPEKKEAVTAKFNDVKNPLKIIIGGRNTCEGIDLNGNSFVMYNCSLGWNPSETIQAEGRIWRQGNLQGHVHVVYPVMNDSIDSVLYQKHDEKRSRINELWNYKGDALNVEDINPEDLKLDLIKDPQKKAKLILMESTKESRAELSRIKLKMQTFDDLIERRKELHEKLDDAQRMVDNYEEQIESYKKTGLEIPEWIKISLKDNRNDKVHAESGLSTIQSKLEALGIKSDEDTMAYIKNVNAQKRMAEDKIEKAELNLPEIIKKLQTELLEKKLTEYPVEKQREILEADILNNLRPMKEVEKEVKTVRFEKMLDEKLRAGDIDQSEFNLYKRVGYERYEKWLNGEIESLNEKQVAQGEKEEIQKPATVEPAEQKNESVKITTESGLPTRKQLEEWKQPSQSDALKELYNDEGGLFYQFADNESASVSEPEQPYFNAGNDDYSLTPEQLTQSEMRRDELVLPILNGKESGMYKAFKDFAERGVFDIVGQKVDLQDYGAISKTGWKQLHAAMNIYRDKRFETMRFVLVNRTSGEIEDQFTSSCHMPNKCGLKNSADAMKAVISRAEEKDCLIVAVHNHPSGRVRQSEEDIEFTNLIERSFTNTDGRSRFGGHIILDHDTFNLYTPDKGWSMKIDLERYGEKDPMANESFELKDSEIVGGLSLSNVAEKVNDINNWNDDFVPVVFANGSLVAGMKLYDKSFFDQDAQKIRNELQFAGLEAGADRAFPVFTEALAKKLGTVMGMAFEERLAELVRLNAFTDAALPDEIMWRHDRAGVHTVTEIYGTKPGLDYYKFSDEELHNLSRIQSTWDTRINPALFAEEQTARNPFPTAKQERPRQKSGAMGY